MYAFRFWRKKREEIAIVCAKDEQRKLLMHQTRINLKAL